MPGMFKSGGFCFFFFRKGIMNAFSTITLTELHVKHNLSAALNNLLCLYCEDKDYYCFVCIILETIYNTAI